jgi:hypothetical protein
MYIQTDKVWVRQARMCVRKRVEGGRVENCVKSTDTKQNLIKEGNEHRLSVQTVIVFLSRWQNKKVSIFFFDRFRIGKNESDFSNNFKRETELNEYFPFFCMNNKSLLKKMVLQREKNKTADRVIIQLLGNLLTNAKLISTKCIYDKDNKYCEENVNMIVFWYINFSTIYCVQVSKYCMSKI